jgi:hypothetical protein
MLTRSASIAPAGLLRTHLRRFLDSHEPGLSPEQW